MKQWNKTENVTHQSISHLRIWASSICKWRSSPLSRLTQGNIMSYFDLRVREINVTLSVPWVSLTIRCYCRGVPRDIYRCCCYTQWLTPAMPSALVLAEHWRVAFVMYRNFSFLALVVVLLWYNRQMRSNTSRFSRFWNNIWYQCFQTGLTASCHIAPGSHYI